ncbi:hypothetical protein QLQ12_10065 [Actinoplanes sp. NEAU-A12]|uniref:Uncharacterized protein n=1 Tax=Actinoplanes sandaracinus TaxID=3045177 RepID=A0ABT6WGU5_9ACTN|nr:hypothetical protein [Actinoplanes sandaracinus]MDI6098944.1 hypothetical protein [Actinoplanes sandaracinus]
MTTDGSETHPTREDRIVAEFGDGYDVEQIAARYGLSIAEIYAVVEREVGPIDFDYPGPPSQYPPSPTTYARPSQAFQDHDAIVAEYGAGHDVEAIARRHRIRVEQVYEVVQRVVEAHGPPSGPTGSR